MKHVSVFFMEGLMKKIKAFFKGVSKEKKMVRWPSGKDLFKYSVMVLTLMVFFGGYFYLLDVLFTFLKGIVG